MIRLKHLAHTVHHYRDRLRFVGTLLLQMRTMSSTREQLDVSKAKVLEKKPLVGPCAIGHQPEMLDCRHALAGDRGRRCQSDHASWLLVENALCLLVADPRWYCLTGIERREMDQDDFVGSPIFL